MNERLKLPLIIIASIIIGASAFTYGALTANPQTSDQKMVAQAPTKRDLVKELQAERSTIIGVLTTAYPKITTDYIVTEGKLYGEGEWYGTTLTYKGKDSLNRDTLRVLMQKKQGVWIVRTTPPQMLLSTVEYPDVPTSVLKSINQPVSLPAGKDSPEVTS